MFKLPGYVQKALDMLHKCGFEAYIVGGCVRDLLLGKEPNDYDMTTSALPRQTEEVFSLCPVIKTGIKHGTVTVMMEGNANIITNLVSLMAIALSGGKTFAERLSETYAMKDTFTDLDYYDRAAVLVEEFNDLVNQIVYNLYRFHINPHKR